MFCRLFRLSALCAMIPSALPAQTPTLRVQPRLLAEAAEVWRVIATPHNPIWPGWDASGTPLLLYRTNVQDVLVNHPAPPPGFVPYTGRHDFAGSRIVLKDGPTIMSIPGQNTSADVAGVRTLVVSDPDDPPRLYSDMQTIVHEAFHVFQDSAAPDKHTNEMLLVRYPVLSVANNVGFALEGAALADALRARPARAFREAAVRWLAVRKDRRAALPAEAVGYEDGVEFMEGLAKYASLRLMEVMNRADERSDMIDDMLRNMRGQVAVNNAPYGTAPLRFRLYGSGMAIAAMLDRLSPHWKASIMRPGATLTGLADSAIHATPRELERALAWVRQQPGYDSLVAAKTQLAGGGRAHADSLLAAIESGPGTGVIVDYSAVQPPRVALRFTPFGITTLDSTRVIFTDVPILAQFPNGAHVDQTAAFPELRDTGGKLLKFRLARELTDEEWRTALAADSAGVFEVPGLRVNAPGAAVRRDGTTLRIVLR